MRGWITIRSVGYGPVLVFGGEVVLDGSTGISRVTERSDSEGMGGSRCSVIFE